MEALQIIDLESKEKLRKNIGKIKGTCEENVELKVFNIQMKIKKNNIKNRLPRNRADSSVTRKSK